MLFIQYNIVKSYKVYQIGGPFHVVNGGNIVKVVVIGAGAIGMLVASFLSMDHQVTLVTRRSQQAEQLNRHGLKRVNLDQTIHHSTITASLKLPLMNANTIVIVAVKYGQLQSIYPLLNSLPKQIPLLFLQNGLAHFEEALTLPQNTIAFGSCQFGAQKENDHTVIHRGAGVLKIAVERGSKEQFSTLLKNKNPKFELEYAPNAEQMLFEKALLNCFINPLTAILKVKNGYLIEQEATLQILKQMYVELKNAFPKEMAKFSFDDVKSLCEKTATNTSSMLADILNERPTEIETIAGAIIRKASKKEIKLPTLTNLYYLLKAEEGKRVEKM